MNSQHWIDIESGITQSKRLVEAVLPESIRIDERSIDDLVTFIAALSSGFNYYNLNNEEEGDWSDFFINDFSTSIILLSNFDLKKYENDYESKLKELSRIRNPSDQLVALDNLCIYVFTFSQLLINFNKRIKNNDADSVKKTLFNELAKGIEKFSLYNNELKSYAAQGTKLFGLDYFVGINEALSDYVVNEEAITENEIFSNGSTTFTEVLKSLPSLTSIFNKFVNGYISVLEIANYYLKSEKTDDGNDSPYIGLLKTFLHLYKHLQLQVNNLTAKHLDFYYRNLLGINSLAAIPDKVHVFFSATPVDESILISKGDILTSGLAEGNNKLQYVVTEDLKVTKAQVTSLCTLFISNYLQISSLDYKHSPINESQVYSSVQQISKAPFTDVNDTLCWPILGEDQHDLANDELTMDNAEIGFMIGSPLFYQQQGLCSFLVRFHLDKTSFYKLEAYINNFAHLNEKKVESAILELFHNAFIIDYTGLEEWTVVPKFSVKFNILDVEKRSIDFTFKLDATDKPLHLYQEKVHNGNYVSEWPLVRFLINNNASLNAFTYLKLLVLDRITIKIDVQDATTFTLQNGNGYLNATAPFMPFGPLPLIGSFIDIRNTNIFNRYTQKFDIDLTWMDLPVIPSGFKNYYAAYHEDIHNSSFKITIDTPSATELNKTVSQKRQAFKLFNEVLNEEGTIFLDRHTKLGHIDMNRLNMQNDMLLEKENALFGATTGSGAIRLELSAPAMAFGHKIYSQKFTEAVLDNSKKRIKVPIPEAPYSPILKSIQINYQLEYTEALLGNGKEDSIKSDFLFYHIFPFGHKREYPGNKEPIVDFLPRLIEAGSLMIGITDIRSEQELSLFFELKQKKFDNAVTEPDDVEWSYLYNDKWIGLGQKNVYSDTTNNLVNSGIIKIKIPKDIHSVHTVLDPLLFWLRVSIKNVPRLKSEVIGIFTNAVAAERMLSGTIYTEGQFILQPNSLVSIENKVQGIQNIWQPFASFGGKADETTKQYYTRVSERLRHRDRPQTILDISQQILEAFPAIFSVKCITKNEHPLQLDAQAEIKLIVIPRYQQMNRLSIEEPKVDLITMYQIKSFIKGKISPFIKVQVCNPVYERIKIVCSIKFKEDWNTDKRLLIKNTEADIKGYICPWLYDPNVDMKAGAKIYLHEILNFLNTLPHVEYVSGFSVLHFYNKEVDGRFLAVIIDTAVTKDTFIEASETGAVLLPSLSHIIETMDTQSYSEPKRKGIGNLSVGKEFTMAAAYIKADENKETEIPESTEEQFTFIIKNSK